MKRRSSILLSLPLLACVLALPAAAADITVRMRKATWDGPGADIGTITISGDKGAAAVTLNLHGLPPGVHGFGVHENDDCGPTLMDGAHIPAGGSGEFWDPSHTGKHEGPEGNGQLGDLPVIEVGQSGIATQTLTAPRITDIENLHGRSLVIAVGGDNYKDTPRVNGGGGNNFACGVIP